MHEPTWFGGIVNISDEWEGHEAPPTTLYRTYQLVTTCRSCCLLGWVGRIHFLGENSGTYALAIIKKSCTYALG